MAERGWHADLCLLRPDETAGPDVERRLKAQSYDCVVIGAGIRLVSHSLSMFEAVINAVHRAAPIGPNQQGKPGQQGQGQGDMNDLDRAGEAMGEAESSLGEGNVDSAVGSQGRALDALRKGAQGLAQSMQQQMGQGLGPGRSGRLGQPRAQQETDPLGRPLRGRDYGDDYTVKPGEIDVQRARAASSRNCAAASATCCARRRSSTTSSGS